MGVYAGDPTVHPASATLPDDGDPDDAAHLNPGAEAALDRTAFLARNLAPSGRTSFYTGVNVPADLTAITGMVNHETRLVIGYGLYVYNSTASGLSDGLYQVDGNGGTGRWQHVEHATFGPRLIQVDTKFYQAAAITMTATGGTCNDPGNRDGAHPTNIGFAILTSANFVLRVGDTIVASYSLPFVVQSSGVGPTIGHADPVVGVGYNATGAGTLVYPDACLDNACQIDVDVDRGGHNLGDYMLTDPGTGDGATNMFRSFARTAEFNPSTTGNQKFSLVVGVKSFVGGKVHQGAHLTISQYRNVVV